MEIRMRYEDFILTIERPRDGVHPVLAYSPAGEGRGTFQVPPGLELAFLVREGASSREVKTASSPSRNGLDPCEVGDLLFQALFSGAVRDLFERSLGRLEDDGDEVGLRLRLRFDLDLPDVARLASLPWELLYRKELRGFLNLSRRNPLVRSLNVPQGLRPLLEPPLRVLIVLANPAGSPPLQLDRERERIEKVLGKVGNIQKEFLPNATPEALRARLLERTFHILHFMGHGTFDVARGQGALLFEDGRGGPASVPGQVVADVLRDFWSLRLVFLNACQTAHSSPEPDDDPFAGVAAALVMAGVPAVLAMRLPVSDDAAIAFSETFYGRLVAGDPIDTAAVEGRMAVYLGDTASYEWATPVLFLRGAESRLIEPAGAMPTPGTSPEIQAGIIDASRFVAEKTAGFVGRQWLFDSIHRFTREKPRGYFILRGDPGIGKSAFLAQMVKREGYLHHFNIRAEGIRSPERFLSNLCSQIIATYGLEHAFLPPEATRDARFLNSLLEKVSARLGPGERAVLLVDALDEADSANLTPGANPLYLPMLLPPGVFLVVTTRREPLGLRIDCEQQTLDIEQDSAGNLADVQEFVESKLPLPGIRAYILAQGLDDATFVAHLVGKSQGNFMYLRYVLPEIESGFYKDRDFADLPEGLQNYYQDHWRRLRSRDEDAWFAHQLPVLVALTVVKEPISIDLIQKFAGVDDRRRIRAVLNEWDQFLYTANVEDEEGQVRKRYRLYHASFHDFVAAKEEVAEERVSLKGANARIADVLLEGMYG
jgi:hypothetical protein